MTYYVLGFLFSSDLKKVLLLEKQTPAWQKGLLNGVGGKLNFGEETPQEAMSRESWEEVRIALPPVHWEQRLYIFGEDWGIFVYRAIGDPTVASQGEHEKPIVADVDQLPANVIPNLRWIVPLVLDSDVKPALIEYTAEWMK